MAVKQKPDKIDLETCKQLDDFINKGGKPGSQNVEIDEEGFQFVNMRVPNKLLKKADAFRKETHIGLSRTAWILLLIQSAVDNSQRDNRKQSIGEI